MQRVSLLNGTNKNYDFDFSRLIDSISTPWIISWLEVQVWKINPWKAFVEVDRAWNKFYILYENIEEIIIDTSLTKKIFIEITQANIDDWSVNNPDGSWIWEIKIGDNYPAKNFLKLASINAWIITDERELIKLNENILNQSDLWNVTKMWNIFNWESSLVKLESDWKLPILDWSKLTWLKTETPALEENFIAWEDLNASELFYIASDSKAYKTDINDVLKINFAWITKANVISWDTFKWITAWIVSWFSGLIPREKYYINWTFVETSQVQQLLENVTSSSNTSVTLWYSSSYAYQRQIFVTPTSDTLLWSLTLKLKKQWNPTDNIICKIYNLSNVLIGEANNKISWNNLTTSFTEQAFNFEDLTLIPNTSYYIRLERDWSYNSSNYFCWATQSWDPYSSWYIWYSSNWTSWSNPWWDHYFDLKFWRVSKWTIALEKPKKDVVLAWIAISDDKLLITKQAEENKISSFSFVAYKNVNQASETIVYTHNKGKKPKTVKCYAMTRYDFYSKWHYDVETWLYNWIYRWYNDSSSGFSWRIFHLNAYSSYTYYWTVSNLDENTISIDYVYSGHSSSYPVNLLFILEF